MRNFVQFLRIGLLRKNYNHKLLSDNSYIMISFCILKNQKFITTIESLHYFRVTTHVVRLKLFRLKAEGVRKARLPYFGGNI
jgi:hypothetical protein